MTFLNRIVLQALVVLVTHYVTNLSHAEDLGRRHPDILQLWETACSQIQPSVVIIRSNDKPVGLGSIVTETGQVLCKASHTVAPITVQLSNLQSVTATRLAIDRPHDLALLQLDNTTQQTFQPLQWTSQTPEVGDLLCIPDADSSTPIAWGTYGAPPREIPRIAPYLGLFADSSSQPGLEVTNVFLNGPVYKAGVRKGDQLLVLGDRELNTKWDINKVLRQYDAGDLLSLTVLRNGQRLELEAQLGESTITPETRNTSLADLFSPKTSPLDDWINRQRQPMMNRFGSGVSLRRSGFPAVSQHDAVVGPVHCGGPAIGLDGTAIGINIARAGRTDTLMIDAPAAQQLLRQLQASPGITNSTIRQSP